MKAHIGGISLHFVFEETGVKIEIPIVKCESQLIADFSNCGFAFSITSADLLGANPLAAERPERSWVDALRMRSCSSAASCALVTVEGSA